MRYRITFAVLLFVLFPKLLLATAQEPDILLMNGKAYSMLTNPLEVFLQQHTEKRPTPEVFSTADRRGYVATWEIKGDRLVLNDVTIKTSMSDKENGSFATGIRSVKAKLFPGPETIVAEWYSGYVVVPTGNLVEYSHMGYASIYDKYLLLRVEKGSIIKRWEADQREYIDFRNNQFTHFQNTEEYKTIFAQLKKRSNMSDEDLKSFMFEYATAEYTSTLF